MWHQRRHPPRVSCIRLAELRAHPFLFKPQFAPQRDEDEGYSKSPAPFAAGDCATDKCQQKPGIDRVANQGVGPTCNEFVTFLQGDGLAPVFSQVTTRPDRKK